MSGQFLSCDVFIDRTEIDCRLMLQYLDLNLASILRGVFTSGSGFGFIGEYLGGFEKLPVGSPDALYVSLLVSWLLGALITFVLYRRGRWRKTAESARRP